MNRYLLLFGFTLCCMASHAMNLKKMLPCFFPDSVEQTIPNVSRILTEREQWDLKGWAGDHKFVSLLRWLRQNPHSEKSFNQRFTYTSDDHSDEYSLWIKVLYYYGNTTSFENVSLTKDMWDELLALLIGQKNIDINSNLRVTYTDKCLTYTPLIILLFQEHYNFRSSCNAWDCLSRAVDVLNILKKSNSVFNPQQVIQECMSNGDKEEKSIFWHIDMMYYVQDSSTNSERFDASVLDTLVEDLVELEIDSTIAHTMYTVTGLKSKEDTVAQACNNEKFKRAFKQALVKRERKHALQRAIIHLQQLCDLRVIFK